MADCSGQTLLEAVVALAILAIGIVSILHVFSTSVTSTREAESYSTAAILANELASQLDNQTDVTAGQETGSFDDASDYTWEADISQPDSNQLMRTAIAVKWMAGNNPREYDMVIYLKSGSTSSSTPGQT